MQYTHNPHKIMRNEDTEFNRPYTVRCFCCFRSFTSTSLATTERASPAGLRPLFLEAVTRFWTPEFTETTENWEKFQ